MTEGFFLSHIRRMRKLYSDRRELFIEQFNNLLGERFTLQISEAGLHFVAWLRSEADFLVIMRFGIETGIRPVPLSFYCTEAKLKPAFVFGFAAWPAAQIRGGLTKLASALREKRKIYAVGKQSYSYLSPCGYVENWGS
jgi:GntR family transcriptional regulator/MocR family aminotransferase